MACMSMSFDVETIASSMFIHLYEMSNSKCIKWIRRFLYNVTCANSVNGTLHKNEFSLLFEIGNFSMIILNFYGEQLPNPEI